MSAQIVITEEYQYVLAMTFALGLQCFFYGFFVGEGSRVKHFPRKFMEQFDKEHQEGLNTKAYAPSIGYPDMGSGRYSKKLSYKSWVQFNIDQRIH